MDDVGFDGQVVVDEFRRPGVVGHNAADGGGSQEHGFGFLRLHPGLDLGLAAQIQFLAGRLEDFTIFGLQTAHQGRTDHAAVAADPDPLSGQ